MKDTRTDQRPQRVSSFFLRVQLSQPYVTTGHTSAFISLVFVEIGMLWLFHIFCSDAPIACPLLNLVRNSVVHSPSSVIRDPRYGNIFNCAVDFSHRINETEVGITEFQCCKRDLMDLLKVGHMHRTMAGVRSRLLASWFCTYSEEIISTSFAFLSLTQQRQSTDNNTQTLSVSGVSLYVTVTHRSPQQACDKECRWREHQEVHANRLWVDQWWHECQRSSSVTPLYDCLPAQTSLNISPTRVVTKFQLQNPSIYESLQYQPDT